MDEKVPLYQTNSSVWVKQSEVVSLDECVSQFTEENVDIHREAVSSLPFDIIYDGQWWALRRGQLFQSLFSTLCLSTNEVKQLGSAFAFLFTLRKITTFRKMGYDFWLANDNSWKKWSVLSIIFQVGRCRTTLYETSPTNCFN